MVSSGLLWNPFLLFIALFVYIGASQEAALAQMKDVSRRFPVSSAMVREFRTLSEDASLQEAVDALLATSQHDFPVVDDTGSVAGLLTRQDLIAALRKNDPALRVGDVMRRDIPTVTTGTRFEDAFRIMQECNCPAVPVLDRMKRLVGLLTPENVTELMMVQSRDAAAASIVSRRRIVNAVATGLGQSILDLFRTHRRPAGLWLRALNAT